MKGWLFLFLTIGRAGFVDAANEVDYQRDIKPLLAQKCSACHGTLKQQAGLRLDAGVLIHKGSDNGPVIVPGKAADSLLIQKVTAEDPEIRMPPQGDGDPLSPPQVALLARWIDSGARTPRDETISAHPRAHWAYRPPQRPALPQVGDSRWSHPIDAFVARQHQRLGLEAVKPAGRHILLRRIYLDLVGLPPTRAQLQSFVQDPSPAAWREVVDSLLDSSHYGERWGRHWMDIWRYSDWDGYQQQLRGSQRHIWRWRDWIIQSLNADKGYDRMIIEMLAGDEVAPDDVSVLPATGFLARNYHNSNRNMWLDATVEHTAKAFLGLTLSCARCHDHKFDPIPQTAYYQFRAIFEPHQVRTDRLPGQPDLMKDGLARVFDADLAAETFLFQQGNDKRPDKEHPMRPAVPVVLGGRLDIQAVPLPPTAYYPALQEFIAQEELASARSQLADAEKSLAEAMGQAAHEQVGSTGRPQPDSRMLQLKRSVAQLRVRSLEKRRAADLAKFTNVDVAKKPNRAQELAQLAADAQRQFDAQLAELTVDQKQKALAAAESSEAKDEKKKQAAVAKANKELADARKKLQAAKQTRQQTDDHYTPLGKEYPHTSSGRRLALARWITADNNPLTARVAVNHIWMRHFGSPLVENVFDFGLRSPRPPHADLLDWLAVELMENDWSMKHLHRLIVTSRTWRLASSAAPPIAQRNRSIDVDNRYLWRMNVRRLDAEIIRDSVLAVSGQLDAALGGADIDFRQGETSRRRSIYLRHAYEKQMTMLVLFDAASPNECYRRSESIIPQQALALANSSLTLGQSRLLARQLWQEVSVDEDQAPSRFVRSAFLQVLGRPPAEEELTVCLEFLTDQTATLSDTSKLTTFVGGSVPQVEPADNAPQRARENLVHVLINHNDFVTVR